MDVIRVGEWADDNPFYLAIADDIQGITIDLGEPGWTTTYAEWLRHPGVFALMRKDTHEPVLMLQVHPGEQPYYVAHHVGIAGGTIAEIVAYGIGKKRVNGEMVRLWLMPNGSVCGGDDVDDIGVRMVKALG